MIQGYLQTGIHIPGWSRYKPRYPAVTEALRQDVRVPNPEYHNALKYGRWAPRNIPRDIACYQWDSATDELVLPIGYLDRLREVAGGELWVDDRRVSILLAQLNRSKIELRDYQVPAVDALHKALQAVGFGLLVAPPGAGKTEIGLHVAWQLGQRTLWITHTQDLAKQVRDRAVSRLGIMAEDIGMLGGGEETVGSFLTVGLVQTLSKMPLLSEWRDHFGCIVLDECHHSPASTWSLVLASFAARYRFGVTGTLDRADGLEAITQLYLGPTTYTIEGSAAETGRITPELRTIRTEAVPPAWTEFEEKEARYKEALDEYKRGERERKPRKPRMPFSTIMSQLLDDDDRNVLLVDRILELAVGRHTLVLSGRVSHCEQLAKAIVGRAPALDGKVAVIHGGMPKAKRAEAITAAQNGAIQILMSVNIAKEGLDVPILDQLVLIAGGKDPNALKQAIGRIQRQAAGKTNCTVWDVVDAKVGVLQAQYWQRRRVYKQLGMLTDRRKLAESA